MSAAILRIRTNPNLKRQLDVAISAGLEELFLTEIVPEAVRNSPVSAANPKIPGSTYRDTGTNRRSITSEIEQTPRGPLATIFTQSGYGGYLELGTALMIARPYIYPAVIRFAKDLGQLVKGNIKRG